MNLFDRESTSFFHTYKRLPLEVDHGEGVYLFTTDGRRYLDFFGGLAVNALGYGHPGVLAAIQEQSKKYIHLSNYFLQEPQAALAEQLLKHAGYQRVFLANSGTESIEGALKLARKWGSTRGKSEIVSFSNSFHGRTMGALSMMDRANYRDGYGPFLEGFRVVKHNDIDELTQAVGPATAAIVLEFIQGEGGIRPASAEFVGLLKQLQRDDGVLIIADEIQSGLGRTGKFFAFEHYDIVPEIVVVAKPLGGGLPLGAILGNRTVAGVFGPGMHGTTFGGNPVACAAGIVVLRELIEGGLMAHAATMGSLLKNRMLELQSEFGTLVREVRGFGLMVGMELNVESEPVVKAMREKGVLINGTNQNVLRLLPPLIIGEDHIEEMVCALRTCLRDLSGSPR